MKNIKLSFSFFFFLILNTLGAQVCTDQEACNYNQEGDCIFALSNMDCYGNPILTNALQIQGVMDLNAPSSNDGKAIHLVALADIPDLSIFGVNISNNGNGSDGVEWTFPSGSSANIGDDILLYRVGGDPNFSRVTFCTVGQNLN